MSIDTSVGRVDGVRVSIDTSVQVSGQGSGCARKAERCGSGCWQVPACARAPPAAVSHGSRRAGAAGMPNDTSLCKTKDRGAACLESPRSASKPHYVVWCVVCVWNIR